MFSGKTFKRGLVFGDRSRECGNFWSLKSRRWSPSAHGTGTPCLSNDQSRAPSEQRLLCRRSHSNRSRPPSCLDIVFSLPVSLLGNASPYLPPFYERSSRITSNESWRYTARTPGYLKTAVWPDLIHISPLPSHLQQV